MLEIKTYTYYDVWIVLKYNKILKGRMSEYLLIQYMFSIFSWFVIFDLLFFWFISFANWRPESIKMSYNIFSKINFLA